MSRIPLAVLDALMLALAAWVAWQVGAAIAGRFTYPYDLEWMEGATLLSGLRARDGLTLYGRPTLDYIPFIYPPLYAWTVGLLAHVFPIGYQLGRGVSVLGSLAGAGALVYAARAAGARWPVAVGCAGIFVGTYDDCGSFFDLVRTDGLSIALLGWSLALASRPGRATRIAGPLLAVAFMAKQHAAIFGLPIALVVWRRDGLREALWYGLGALLPAALFTGVMQWSTDGLFTTWLLGVPATHGIVSDRLIPWVEVTSWSPLQYKSGGALTELWKALPVTTTAAILLPMWLRRGGTGLYWAVVGLVAIVTVSLMRGHTGGFVNVLIPGFWVFALAPALLDADLGGRWRFGSYIVPGLLAGQLWKGQSDLAHFVPTEQDRASVASFLDELRTFDEPLLLPHAPFAAYAADKQPQFALIALWDIDHKDTPFRGGVRAVDRAIAQQHWATIILPADTTFDHGLKKHYKLAGTLKSRSFGMRTGWGVRLRQIWVPDPGKVAPPKDPLEEAPDEPSGTPPEEAQP